MKLFGVACVVVLLTAAPVSGQGGDALPDWSGVWRMVGGTVFDRASATRRGGRAESRPARASTLQRRMEAIYQRNLKLRDELLLPDPITNCGTPAGFPRVMNLPDMYEFVVRPEQTWVLTENGPNVLRIYTDGRAHPAAEDMWPTYTGIPSVTGKAIRWSSTR